MSDEEREKLSRRLAPHAQDHVLRWWDELDTSRRAVLAQQIELLDCALIAERVQSRKQGAHAGAESPAERARRAAPPTALVRLPRSPEDRNHWEAARQAGEALLAAGKVGAILVAGGQGTRLGFDKPKGMFPIGPISQASLFQILAEQLLARSHRAGRPIPYFIMTSDATHDETVEFFDENQCFGLRAEDVYFFLQGNMPAVDSESGKLLMADKGLLSTSPDGHGGMLGALANAGLLDVMRERGIERVYYHQVDNPTAIVCDPFFLGFHALRNSEMSTKVVAKRRAEERMGVAVDVDGRTEIIEYSDLPIEIARKTDAAANLLLWAGSTAIHVFDRVFLERIAGDAVGLPFHVAHKKVPHLDQHGRLVQPEMENACKFERFIFDALPFARKSLVFEADRASEFNPVKNADGDDSPATSRAAMMKLHRGWLRTAGAHVAETATVEISPLFALDASELSGKVPAGLEVGNPSYLT